MQTKGLFVFNVFSIDGGLLCDGHAARSAWTSWTVYRMFVQCSSQVRDFPQCQAFFFFLCEHQSLCTICRLCTFHHNWGRVGKESNNTGNYLVVQ